jgi:uncharacterized protein (UPF0248 family)
MLAGKPMQTIIDLVNEIRWSKFKDPSDYNLGYYDRVCKDIHWIRFVDIDFTQTDKFALVVKDEKGGMKHIPFHRFRRVRCGDEIVWKRDKEEN